MLPLCRARVVWYAKKRVICRWLLAMSWISVPPWLSLPLPTSATTRRFLCVLGLGLALSAQASAVIAIYAAKKRAKRLGKPPRDDVVHGVAGLIGNTPLMRIGSLSDVLGVEILGKVEFLNPGGSVKDRVALRIIDDAEREGLLVPHTQSRIFEGTVGSTGISIATIARARGYDTTIIMPDDVAAEKVQALHALGADVLLVRPASIVDKNQYVNLARRHAEQFTAAGIGAPMTTLASDTGSDLPRGNAVDAPTNTTASGNPMLRPRGFFADQFENRSNYDAHFLGTGPEIWRQTGGRVTAFVSGAGTGGTIAGVGQYLKSRDPNVLVALADPEGSGMYNKVKHGVMFDLKETEGTKRRHQVDTVVEGIGLNRMIANFEMALPSIDDAFRVTDAEAVSMSRYLVQNDGLFLGSSSACNLVACVKLVKRMGWRDGETVVTVLCDQGSRHYSKFWNDAYLKEHGLPSNVSLVEDMLRQ